MITLTSDFGPDSVYIATAKAYLLTHIPNRPVVDITHKIEPCDISEAAYVLQTIMHDFPLGTIHLVAVDSKKRLSNPEILVTEIEGQYFIGYNSGLLTMLSPNAKPTYYLGGSYPNRHFTSVAAAFGPIARQIASGKKPSDVFEQMNKVNKKSMISPVITDQHISGNVMYFDERGIAYTNIQKSMYDGFVEGNKTVIRLTRFETLKRLKNHLAEGEPGTAAGFFNERGYLCIGIYHEDTRSMLGFKKGHGIKVEKI